MRTLWIHIGTPKTGSTAIQRFTRDNKDYLNPLGFDFLTRHRSGSYNDLSVALRSGNHDRAVEIGGVVRNLIGESASQNFVLSSEMFSGADPAALRDVLALPEPMDVKIVGYFRRQDKYLANAYKQKLKTAKTRLGFENFITKFGTGGGEYRRIVDAWQAAWPEADFLFRRFDPKTFPQGDVVRDFLQVLGIDTQTDGFPTPQSAANATPSIDVLDLMQLVKNVPEVHIRRVFRSLPQQDLPRFSGGVMDNATAKALLVKFAADNEALRARFFPDEDALFDVSDLDGPEPDIAMSSFTDEQRAIVQVLLQAVAKRAVNP